MIVLASQFYVYLMCLVACLALCLNRGLRDCENRWIVCSSSPDTRLSLVVVRSRDLKTQLSNIVNHRRRLGGCHEDVVTCCM